MFQLFFNSFDNFLIVKGIEIWDSLRTLRIPYCTDIFPSKFYIIFVAIISNEFI